MRTLIYKRTHPGDPDRAGRFGIHDCMGRIRRWSFEAVIGVGGVGAGPELHGLAAKVNWIGIGPHKSDDLGDELREQTIALLDAGDRATGEEAVAQVANRAFDLTFLSRFSNSAELRLDAHRGAQGEERGMKPRHRTDALEHDDLGVVEQPLASHATERAAARTSDRHNEWTVRSMTNSPHIAREYANTITNIHSARTPPGTATSPT